MTITLRGRIEQYDGSSERVLSERWATASGRSWRLAERALSALCGENEGLTCDVEEIDS